MSEIREAVWKKTSNSEGLTSLAGFRFFMRFMKKTYKRHFLNHH